MSLTIFSVEIDGEEIEYPYPDKEIRLLSHPVKAVRLRAYKSVETILAESTRDGAKIDTYPLFLIASGDSLAAIDFLISEASILGEFQNTKVATEVFLKTIDEYRKIQKVLVQNIHPEFETLDRRLCSALGRGLRALSGYFPPSAEKDRLYSLYLEKIAGKKAEAHVLLKGIIHEKVDGAIPEDFSRMGDLTREIGGEVNGAAEFYYRGLEKFPADAALFERYARYLLEVFGEEKAKQFYKAFREKTQYSLPFSAIRGSIVDSQDHEDLVKTVGGFLKTGNTDEGMMEYFRKTHFQFESGYNDQKDEIGLPPSAESSPESIQEYFRMVGAKLIFLEQLLFGFSDYRYTLEYITLIDTLCSIEGGRSFLISYFFKNPFRPEGDDPSDGVTPSSSDINSGFTLESEIEKRYAYIGRNFFYLIPGIFSGGGYEIQEVAGSMKDTEPTFSGITSHILGDKMLELSGNEHAATRGYELSEMLKKEAEFLMLSGDHSGWRDKIIKNILEKYSPPILHTLCYHARHEEYTGLELPPLCTLDPELACFFIMERLIAGTFTNFGESFLLLAKKYRLYDIPFSLAITLSDFLMAQGYYTEAFAFLKSHPSTLHFTAGIFKLTECLKYVSGREPDLAEDMLDELDEVVRGSIQNSTFIQRIQICLDGVTTDSDELHAAFLSEGTKLQKMKQDWYKKEFSDLKDEMGKLAYCLSFLFAQSEPETSVVFMDIASQNGNPESCLLQLELERGTELWDAHDAICRLETQLFERDGGLPFPIKKDFIIVLIELAFETKDEGRRERYFRMARMYGIDIFDYELPLLLEKGETRKLLYEYILTKDLEILFRGKQELMLKLQNGIQADMLSPDTPLELRLLASFIKRGISSDKEFEYIPVTLEYWQKLNDNLSHPYFDDTFPHLIEKGFGVEIEGETVPIRCLTALEYLIEKDDVYFQESLSKAKLIPKGELRPFQERYRQFLESVLTILGTYPESSYEVSRFSPRMGENSLSLYAYWRQRLQYLDQDFFQIPIPPTSFHNGNQSIH